MDDDRDMLGVDDAEVALLFADEREGPFWVLFLDDDFVHLDVVANVGGPQAGDSLIGDDVVQFDATGRIATLPACAYIDF